MRSDDLHGSQIYPENAHLMGRGKWPTNFR